MASVDLEKAEDLFKRASDRSAPGPVYQPGQQSSDADHLARTNIPSGFINLKGPQAGWPMPLPTPPSSRNHSWKDERPQNLVEHMDAQIANLLEQPPPCVVSHQTSVDDYERHGNPADSLQLGIPPIQLINDSPFIECFEDLELPEAFWLDCGARFARTTERYGHLILQQCRKKRAEPIAEIEDRGQPTDSEPINAMSKEAQHSLSSTAASFPVLSLESILTATGGLTVEEMERDWAALFPDDTCGLIPEEMPRDMSDMSDGESFETSSGSEGPNSPTSLAESRRDVLIDRTISWMITWIDSRLSVLAFQTHGTCEESPRSASLPQTETCGTTDGLDQKRRRGWYKNGRGPDDEGSDGEERVPPPSQESDAVDNEEIVEFACPFLKHNPRKYGQIRSCSASGWKAIFRLKEHLYRCHRLPSFQCIRCRMTFKSSEKLLQHSQADKACNVVRDESSQEGISHEQLMKLKSRKRSREASSEHDRWVNMYKILFPDDYLIPSPYFQRGNSGKGQESLLTAFREHVSRELPRLIRPRLEESVDATIREALGPDVLEGLVRDIFSQVLSTFPQHKSETPAAMFGKKRKGETSQPTEMFPHLALPGSNSLGLSDVSTFNVEPNASAAWVFSHQAGIEQAESCQEEGQRIDNESSKWQMGYEDPTGVEPGPSNFLSADEHTYLQPATGDNVVDASSLSDLFNFDDFRDEYAAWLGLADEGSSHADSGYFSSLQSVESMDHMTGKSKGKEVVREPGEHDIT